MVRRLALGMVGLLALLASTSSAQTPPASVVIDGDTLRYKGAVVHLWGIDAPERGQTCRDGWPAGQMAVDYLAGLIHNRALECQTKPWPATPGRTFALCKVDGQDLSAAMAAAGMAWSVTEQTKDYTVQESDAMYNLLGVHGNACRKAWEWRMERQGTR